MAAVELVIPGPFHEPLLSPSFTIAATAAKLRPSANSTLKAISEIIERCVNSEQGTVQPVIRDRFLFINALLNYRLGNWQSALTIVRKVMGHSLDPAPSLLKAMCEFRAGDEGSAHDSLLLGERLFNWSPSEATSRDVWMYHALRREAEALLLPNLPRFAAGTYLPKANDERLAFAGYCQSVGLNLALCNFYLEAFSTDPTLEHSRQMDYLFKAARSAALAGNGIGLDSQNLSAAERKIWRQQAMKWLELDLNAACNINKTPAFNSSRNDHIAQWRTDRDLAYVRESKHLDLLDSDERNRWLKFWRNCEPQTSE